MNSERRDPLKLAPGKLVEDYRSAARDPRQVLESIYAQIAKQGERPVWITLQPFERALAALDVAERRGRDTPLFGVPFAVKDNIDVAGLPTTAACPEFAYVPAVNAQAVEQLIQAGAIVIGKTNLDQFATGLVGTRSPYGACSSVFDARYISGGSSSGSAVAVARGDVSFSLGTDTAGSGRVPAAFNELFGVKPTRGLLSTRGVVPACRSLDCVSIFARELDDAEALLALAAGYDALDPFSRRAPKVKPLRSANTWRLGVPRSAEFFGDSESERLFEQAVEKLSQLGAQLVPVDLEPFHATAALLYQGPWVAERLAAVGDFCDQHPAAVQPVLCGILAAAKQHSARDAFAASYQLAALRRQTEPLWETIDALVLPTAPTHYTLEEIAASPLELNQRLGTYTNFVNLLDLSGLALPAGRRSNGLPFGVTYLAPAFHEAQLFELARFANGVPPAKALASAHVELAVAGAHLSGQPLNHELTNRGARLLQTARTSSRYRLFALATTPEKPGLVYVGDTNGASIEVEVWELDEQAFGSFVRAIPRPMGIGTTELSDGRAVKGFICESSALQGAEDITAFGGWRAYREARAPR